MYFLCRLWSQCVLFQAPYNVYNNICIDVSVTMLFSCLQGAYHWQLNSLLAHVTWCGWRHKCWVTEICVTHAQVSLLPWQSATMVMSPCMWRLSSNNGRAWLLIQMVAMTILWTTICISWPVNFFSHSYVHTLGAVMVKYTAHILMLFTLVEMDRQTDRQETTTI